MHVSDAKVSVCFTPGSDLTGTAPVKLLMREAPSPAKQPLYNWGSQRHTRYPAVRVHQRHFVGPNLVLVIPTCPSRLALCSLVAFHSSPFARLGRAVAASVNPFRGSQGIYMCVAPAWQCKAFNVSMDTLQAAHHLPMMLTLKLGR